MELQALSLLAGRNVFVYQEGQPRWTVTNHPGAPRRAERLPSLQEGRPARRGGCAVGQRFGAHPTEICARLLDALPW